MERAVNGVQHGIHVWLLTTLTLVGLTLVTPKVASAIDTTCGYAFYGPAGNYRIELFEVGRPWPSRTDDVIGYGGYFTYRRNWYAIVANRSYFIRVTDLRTRSAKQTHSFWVTYNGGFYQFPTCNWNQNFLGH